MSATLDVAATAGTPDITAVRGRMKATWEAGNYATFATQMEPGAESLLATWDVRPGQRLLDVACAAGQIAIPAARRGVDATGVDIAENLLAAAAERAAAETERRLYPKWVYPFPVSDVVDFFGQHFGPVVRDDAALDADARAALRSDLVEVFSRFDRGPNGETHIEGEFLSVDVTR